MKLKRAEDMAKKLGISTETFLDWRSRGMPWVKIGKLIFILEDSFLHWAKDHEISQNAQDAPGQDFFGRPISKARPPKKMKGLGGRQGCFEGVSMGLDSGH